MGHKVSFGITGPAIKSLKASLVRKHLRRAVTVASRPVQKDAKAEAQTIRKRGFLAKSLATKVKTYGNAVVSIIGVRTDKRFPFGTVSRGPRKGQTKIAIPAKYLHFLELGTSRSRKRPVVGAAATRNRQSFQSRCSKEFWTAVQKELRGA